MTLFSNELNQQSKICIGVNELLIIFKMRQFHYFRDWMSEIKWTNRRITMNRRNLPDGNEM